LAAPDALTFPLTGIGLFGGLGVGITGAILQTGQAEQFLPIGIGSLGTAALIAVSTAIRVPLSHQRLMGDYQRIRTPERRARLTASQLAAMERRFQNSEPAIPMRFQVVPYYVGFGTAMFVAAADDDTDPADRRMFSMLGTLWSTMAIVALCSPTPYERYQSKLEETGFTVEVMPTLGGLQAVGSF